MPRVTPREDPGDDRSVDLYKFAVEMADRVSARRGTANAYFLAVQTTLVAVLSLGAPNLSKSSPWISGVASVAGIALSMAWWLQLRSYRSLNSAKFAVITELEKDLGLTIYQNEWRVLSGDRVKRWRYRYAELGATERFVPWVFAVLYIVLIVVRLTRR